ncbi:MAG: hypothetical protein NC254_10060, partial [bacterium]|nr:hypothetical protein [bacterium]
HDRQSGRTRWAAAFKATTWGEFQMLAEEDLLFQKVSDALYLLSENPEVAEQCRRRMEAEAIEKHRQEREAEREKKYAELDKAFAEQANALVEKDSALVEKDNALAEMGSALAEMGSALAKKDNALSEKDNIISEKDHTIAEQATELALLRAQIEALSHKD